MSVDIAKCEACTEVCPQVHARHEAATGRMYAMRELAKCAPYWDVLFDENEKPKVTPDRLRELVEADREGRCKIHPRPENNTCGSCGHFQRISGRRCGICDVFSKYRDRYGRVDDRRGTFTPSQSKKACKRYEPKEE